MLTPAEELGLSGQALASRVHHALYRLGQDRLVHLVDELRTEALTRHLVYFRSGEIEPVYTIVVDQDEMVIQKLVDRGTHQAFGIVRNVDDFLDRIVSELKKLEA